MYSLAAYYRRRGFDDDQQRRRRPPAKVRNVPQEAAESCELVTRYREFNRKLLRACADLLSNYLSQRFIDSVLPAQPGALKVIKNVPVNSQRDKILGIRDGRALWREFCGLRGCCLERRFSHLS